MSGGLLADHVKRKETWICKECNTEHETLKEAEQCADQCLTQKQRDSDKVRKVD